MNRELIVNVNPTEISIALCEDKVLVELNKEQCQTGFAVGDIYLGKVRKIMPGLNAAFVNIGHEKDAFIHYLDLGPQFPSLQKLVASQQPGKRGFRVESMKLEPPVEKTGKIGEYLQVGQQIMVQVAKEAISTKGPRLTADISLAGRNVVLVPFTSKVFLSQKIRSADEKKRLKRIAAAVLPAIFLLVHVYRADKLEKEPAPLLISLVLYGIAATFIALVLERAGSFLLGLWFEEGSVAYNAIMYFGIVAFSEEGAKYFLLRRRTWHSAAFNCQFDGVVYAVFVALGFALWENISYVLMYGLSTALVRAVTAVPGHACFGVFMGVWYGLAKRLHGQGRDSASKLCRVLALLLPALLHGCYDFIASIESVHYGWLFAAFVAILFVLAFILVRRQARHDRYINNYDAEYL